MTPADQTRSMRELTKSALAFSWAISLLSINRAAGLLSSGRHDSDVLEPMTQVATDRLDHFMKGIYRSGNDLQARIIDFAFSWVDPGSWLKPKS